MISKLEFRNFALGFSLVASLFAFSHSATASTPSASGLIADCWIESGAALADGEFAVNLQTKSISKKNLVAILGQLSGRYLQPIGYPLVFGDQMFVYVRATDTNSPALSRIDLKAKVQEELEAIVAISKGVSASCNYLSFPAPAVGVRN